MDGSHHGDSGRAAPGHCQGQGVVVGEVCVEYPGAASEGPQRPQGRSDSGHGPFLEENSVSPGHCSQSILQIPPGTEGKLDIPSLIPESLRCAQSCCCSTGPAIGSDQVYHPHGLMVPRDRSPGNPVLACPPEDIMAVDPQLLEMLVCPECKTDLELVGLPDALCGMLVDRYREKFRDELPEVREGLRCTGCRRVYPIVSDIPVMLLEEAIPPEA